MPETLSTLHTGRVMDLIYYPVLLLVLLDYDLPCIYIYNFTVKISQYNMLAQEKLHTREGNLFTCLHFNKCNYKTLLFGFATFFVFQLLDYFDFWKYFLPFQTIILLLNVYCCNSHGTEVDWLNNNPVQKLFVFPAP